MKADNSQNIKDTSVQFISVGPQVHLPESYQRPTFAEFMRWAAVQLSVLPEQQCTEANNERGEINK